MICTSRGVPIDTERGHKVTRTQRNTKFELNLLSETWSLRDFVASFIMNQISRLNQISPRSGFLVMMNLLLQRFSYYVAFHWQRSCFIFVDGK